MAKEWLNELPPESPKQDSSAKRPQGANPPADKEANISGADLSCVSFSPLARSYREEYHGKNGAFKTRKELVPERSPRESPSNTVSSSGRRPGSDLGARSRQDAMVDLQPLCKRPRQATGVHSVAPPDALQDSAKESLKLPARINLQSIGFRRLVRIQQQQGRAKQHKTFATFGPRVKKLINMYVLLSSISYDTPRHRIAP